jgi:DNA-binding transcriptional LysR family regulator
MTLQQLYYFKMVAEFEHYGQAAEKLNVVPSNLAHSINKGE